MEHSDKYSITFELPQRGQMSSSHFFNHMSNVLIGFEELNESLLTGLDSELKVVSYVEDIEEGSIRVWLVDVLKKPTIDNDIRDITSAIPTAPFVLIKLKNVVLRSLESDDSDTEKSNTIDQEIPKILEEYAKESHTQDFLQAEKWDADATKKAACKIVSGVNELPSVTIFDQVDGGREITGRYGYVDPADQDIINITTRYLVIHRPELSEKAKQWSFLLADRAINADISDTDIAKNAVTRGEVRVGDTYKVNLQERQYKTQAGQTRIDYKVLQVLGFTRGQEQARLKL